MVNSNILIFGGSSDNSASYIQDIVNNDSDSYVLNIANENIWQKLLNSSVDLYSTTSIHDTIYDRLTTNEVDLLILNNNSLGECFNEFYEVSSFADGDIKKVLAALTASSLNTLEAKLQFGLFRYISTNTSGASGVGEWLANIYNIPALSNYTSMAAIIADSDLWSSTIMANEALRLGISFSQTAINLFNTMSTSQFDDFTSVISHSICASAGLFNALENASSFTTLLNDSVALGYIFDDANSMTALIYHPAAFQQVCGSSAAVATLGNHTSQYNILFSGWNISGTSELTLNIISSDLTTLTASVSQLPPESHSTAQIILSQGYVESAIDVMELMNSGADVIVANLTALNNSSIAWAGISKSATAMQVILANPTAYTNAFNSEMAMQNIASSTLWMPNIVVSEDCMTVISSSSVALKHILLSPYATGLVKKNATAWAKFVSTTSEATIGGSSATVTALQASERYATISCGSVYIVGYGYLTTFRGYANLSYTGNVFIFTSSGGSREFIRACTNSWQDIPASANMFGNSCRGYGYTYRYSGYAAGSSATVFKLY